MDGAAAWLKSAIPALALAVLVYPGLADSIKTGYADDTFFHLTVSARIGLAVLAGVAATGLLFVSVKKGEYLHRVITQRLFAFQRQRVSHGVALLLDLCATALLFMIGISLAPQLFYTYYQTIFQSLPAQWVIAPVWTLSFWQERIFLEPNDTMADQAIAILFWTLIFVCVISAALRCRKSLDS